MDAVFKLPKIGYDKSKLDDEILVSNLNSVTFRTAFSVKIEQPEEEPEDYNTPQQEFVPVLPGVYSLSDKTEESYLEIWDLREFITAQKADNESGNRNRHSRTITMGYR